MPGLTAVDLSSSSNNGKKDDFKMTPEEAKRLEEKMKDPEFMKLWVEYAQSLADPKVRAEEEEYLRQVEEEAKNTGDDSFDFIFPKPAYCIELLNCPDKKKGCSRVGVNICTSDKIERFTEQATGRNRMGHWYVPVSLSLAREEKKALENSDWEVFDAVFHPDTVKLANQSDQFTTFLTQIIVENINEGYKRRFEFEYKRFPSSVTKIGTDPKNQTVRRDSAKASKSSSSSASSSKNAGTTSREVTLGPISASFNEDEIAKKTQQQKIVVESAQSSKASSPVSAHHSPSASAKQQLSKNTGNIKMTVAHRGEIDLTDAWNWAKLDKRIGIPKELVLRAQLPTVERASELDVDIVKGVSVEIACPAKKLQGAMMLDFTVEETPVSAKFERTKKELTLVLKVVPPPAPPSAVAPAEEAQEQHQNKNNDDDENDDDEQQQQQHNNKKQQEQADAAEEKRQQEEKERVERLKRAQELLEEKKRREEKQEQEEKDKAAEKAKKEAEAQAQQEEKKRAKEQQEEMMRKRQEAWLKEEEERKQQQQKKKAEEEEAELKRKKAVEEEQERKAKEAAAAKIINNNNDDDANNNNNNQQQHEEQDSSSLLLIDDDDEDFMPKKSDTENKKDEMLLREAAKKSADAQKQEETMQAELDKKMKQLPLTNAFIFSID